MTRRAGRIVSLADIASAAGVDTSTVSRVLRAEPGYRVAADTRARVLAVAKELDYQPNVIARGLRTSRTHTLGIAVPQLENPVFPQLIFGAEAAARERGYSLFISHVVEQEPGEAVYEKLARVARVDGLLAATLGDDRVMRRALQRLRVPAIVLNRRVDGLPHYAAFDNFAAGRMATEYLIELGHRRIAHLAGRPDGYNGKQRLAGYYAALSQAGLVADPELVVAGGYSFGGGVSAMQSLLTRRPPCTAVVAATLISAAGAVQALHASGVAVPQRVSVIAIHDAQMAEMIYPPLTTVRLPLYALGHQAASGLIDLIEGRSQQVTVTLAPEGVIQRGSTAAPASAQRLRG